MGMGGGWGLLPGGLGIEVYVRGWEGMYIKGGSIEYIFLSIVRNPGFE